ncbi:MAG TPA: hypothetical protein VFO38_04365 [Candidatus Saccharimonadales bacterium]|nr:hypothetical protein [Candidatus Saccharimonadales bacterium]
MQNSQPRRVTLVVDVPAGSEVNAEIDRFLELLKEHGSQVHVRHLSSARPIEDVRVSEMIAFMRDKITPNKPNNAGGMAHHLFRSLLRRFAMTGLLVARCRECCQIMGVCRCTTRGTLACDGKTWVYQLTPNHWDLDRAGLLSLRRSQLAMLGPRTSERAALFQDFLRATGE